MGMTIEIPNGSTNGDVIKTLFPDYTYIGTCILDKYENILMHDINYNWWNAPYTKEQTTDPLAQSLVSYCRKIVDDYEKEHEDGNVD